MAGTNGKQKTVRDMILSLALIGLAAGFIYLLVPHDDHPPDIQRVDYRVELLTARRAATYPVAAPEGLPSAWKATSVRFQGEAGDRWHLGYQTPDGQYVQIEQSTQKPVADFLTDASQGATATKTTEKIGDRTWTHYTGGRYDALVLENTPGSTTVVAGTASFTRLTEMAAALKMS